MDKLSPVGNNRISSATSSVSPLVFLCTPHLQARSHDEMWVISLRQQAKNLEGREFDITNDYLYEGARLKGSSWFCSSLYAYGILDEGYKFNLSVEEAAELAWRAFITQYSVTELVVAVFLVGLTDQFLSGRKAFSVRLDLKKQSKIWLSFLLTWLVTSISLIL
ncbi:uncharacterized protein [Aegilops tauschii subsp. strangulata]|uniref:Uncharacterized protein n=2 Tax=Aegilops tauschii subsp. strangulata TaxID=200361 RepID=A0A452Y012_AEGTS|nr:uncharacterized protein LOC109783385 isoform X1 [Aegilops tauschii subsp. strangulata]XP_044448495.1 uncharacterized protein LOC123180487 isoform X1 [Triticum aestivum]XP_044448496.1 uncharacterized protein LOC123180487 isoform X1 [Triticum aestivum]